MVATDVASRGLDVDDIKLVINFDMPQNIEDYIHRIGRTGRRGRQGKAVSMLERSEATKKLVRDLIEVLKEAKQEVSSDLLDLQYSATFEGHSNSRYGGGGGYNRPNNNFRRFNSDQYGERSSYGGYNRSFNQRKQGGLHRSHSFQNAYERQIDNDDQDFSMVNDERNQRFENRRNSNRGPRTNNFSEDDESFAPRNQKYNNRRNSDSSPTDIYDTVLSNLKRD